MIRLVGLIGYLKENFIYIRTKGEGSYEIKKTIWWNKSISVVKMQTFND